MNRGTRHLRFLAGIVTLALATPAIAEERPADGNDPNSFAGLAERLSPGETLFVTRPGGDVVHGRVLSASPLTLESPRLLGRDGQLQPLEVDSLELAESDVKRLEVVRKDSIWNGALIGLGAGAAVVVAADCNSPECDDIQAVAIPLTLALGASVGALFDALRTEREVVYDMSAADRGLSLSVAPVVNRHRRGVLVTLRF